MPAPRNGKTPAAETGAIQNSILLGGGDYPHRIAPGTDSTTLLAAGQPEDLPERWEPDVRVFRPAKGRVEITLPDYAGASKMLHTFAPCVVWSPRRGAVPYRRVSRVHLEAIVDGLLRRYGEITLVTEHFAQEICSSSCYSAKSADWLCTCGGCAARNHGGGAPLMGWRLRSEPDDFIETDGLYLTRTRNLSVDRGDHG